MCCDIFKSLFFFWRLLKLSSALANNFHLNQGKSYNGHAQFIQSLVFEMHNLLNVPDMVGFGIWLFIDHSYY